MSKRRPPPTSQVWLLTSHLISPYPGQYARRVIGDILHRGGDNLLEYRKDSGYVLGFVVHLPRKTVTLFEKARMRETMSKVSLGEARIFQAGHLATNEASLP